MDDRGVISKEKQYVVIFYRDRDIPVLHHKLISLQPCSYEDYVKAMEDNFSYNLTELWAESRLLEEIGRNNNFLKRCLIAEVVSGFVQNIDAMDN